MDQHESLIPDTADYLIENNPAAIISLDPSLNIIQANRAFVQLSGYSSETIKGMNISSFHILQSKGGSLTDATEKKQVVSGSVIVQFPSGKRYLEYRYIPVFNSHGDITGIGIVYIDKTPEMRDNERSSVIIEKNPCGICVFNRELLITQVNEAFLLMSGYKREDLIGKQIAMFDVIDRKGARPADVIEKKERMNADIQVSFPVGRRYLAGSYTPILDEQGMVTEVIEFLIDCTKEKEAARDILAVAEKARHGDFTDRITSHYYEGDLADIANEINSILDYVAAPLGEIVRISEKFASGIFNARFSDKIGVKGDFLQVRDALNTISDSIHSSLEILAKTCDSYAKGDFTSQLDDINFADSGFKKMKQSLTDVGRSMGSALHLISEQTKMLEKTTLDASKTIIHVSESASQVAASADVVKTNTERCQVGIKQIFSAMEDLSIAVDGVAQKVEKAATFSSDTNHLCKKGEDLTRIAEAGIEGITLSTSEVDAMIQEIKNQMAKIDKIVLLITEISNQTNLLALNAAIEAARAGDAGRGFAVVATEVKSLAQESKSSAEEITGLIRSLQSTSDRAGTVMKAALNEVEKGGSAVTQSIVVFSEVIHSVNEISTIMEEIAVASEEQAAGVEEITASVSEVKHYVEETAVESDRTAAASRESSHATDQIADKINEVEQAVAAVSGKISEFRYR